jgi:hypothetical protein
MDPLQSNFVYRLSVIQRINRELETGRLSPGN